MQLTIGNKSFELNPFNQRIRFTFTKRKGNKPGYIYIWIAKVDITASHLITAGQRKALQKLMKKEDTSVLTDNERLYTTSRFGDQYYLKEIRLDEFGIKPSSPVTAITPATDSCLVVQCTAHGNIDFNQNPDKMVAPKKLIPCNTFREASDICSNYIKQFDLGGGNWTGGQVYHPTKGLIARISYNGRVWKQTVAEVPGTFYGTEEITDMDTNDY